MSAVIKSALSMLIPAPSSMYQVKFLQYGYFYNQKWHPASWRTIEVKAACQKDALKLVKARHRRAEQFSVVGK